MTVRDDLRERVAEHAAYMDEMRNEWPEAGQMADDMRALLSEREPVAAYRILRAGIPWHLCGDEDGRDRVLAMACEDGIEDTLTVIPLYAGPAPERGEAREDGRLYPCDHSGCDVMRTKAEGGTTFTVCEEHWKERGAAQVAPAITEEGEDE